MICYSGTVKHTMSNNYRQLSNMQPTFFSFIALLQKVRTLIIKLLRSRNYDKEMTIFYV